MKKAAAVGMVLAALFLLPLVSLAQPPGPQIIKLSEPDKTRGLPVMQALSLRASVREWSEKELSPQDLSDLLWAANGINRPDKRKTAASAMNAQDVDIYVFLKDGVYLYDAAAHALVPVVPGDQRSQIGMMPPGGRPGGSGGRPSTPPVQLLLVSDVSRFGAAGSPEQRLEWGAIDTGLVSQNIALFCAGTGLGTRPRASIAKDKLRVLLKLRDTQYPMLEHPVGYKK